MWRTAGPVHHSRSNGEEEASAGEDDPAQQNLAPRLKPDEVDAGCDSARVFVTPVPPDLTDRRGLVTAREAPDEATSNVVDREIDRRRSGDRVGDRDVVDERVGPRAEAEG